jgi:ribosomal protein L14E/L6E/L27E
MISPGLVCYKIAGRDAGQKVVVISMKGNFAEVVGLRKKRKVSIRHLEPTKEKLDPKMKEEDILKKLKYKRKVRKKKVKKK